MLPGLNDLLKAGVQVEAEPDEFDSAVERELAGDGEARNEKSGRHQDAVFRTAGDQRGHRVELCGELFDNAEQFVDLEVVGGRFAVRTSFWWELAVEVLEELCVVRTVRRSTLTESARKR